MCLPVVIEFVPPWSTSVEPEAKLKGDNKFYPCLYGYLSVCMSLFGFYSITSPKANHLKFMQKVRNYKKNAKFSFGLYYHFFCSGVLPLDLLKSYKFSFLFNIQIIWNLCPLICLKLCTVWIHSSILFQSLHVVLEINLFCKITIFMRHFAYLEYYVLLKRQSRLQTKTDECIQHSAHV